MRARLAILLVVVIVGPLIVLGLLGVRLVQAERMAVQARFQELLSSRVIDAASRIRDAVERETGTVDDALWSSKKAGTELGHPLLLQRFEYATNGRMVFPNVFFEMDDAARDYLDWAWETMPAAMMANESDDAGGASQWTTLQTRTGKKLVRWRRTEEGSLVGAEVNRTAWLARLLADLPTTGAPERAAEDCFRLVDDDGALIYQWGQFLPGDGTLPDAGVTLGAPLNGWRLELFVPAAASGPLAGSTPMIVFGVLIVLAIFLGGIGVWLATEVRRDLREASQRVRFVSQVSHELKTPLTNIRLYAELLDESLDEDAEDDRKRLGVIVSESRRLSRLIDNVLTFSRERQGRLKLHVRGGDVAAKVHEVVEQFRPALEAAGVEATFECELAADVETLFDPDGLEQIVGNLLSNVEKYASEGGRVLVHVDRENAFAVCRVCDSGPGIPGSERERVFAPFHRLDNRLTARASGAGLGLSLARTLAREMGGELQLEPRSEAGACFILRLPISEQGGNAER
ncbi:HAMP domain-containing histidine kinase [bacterium]|nr:HAMP domain-containing histidine kinase [bacterium]